jgi:hypothetical protein
MTEDEVEICLDTVQHNLFLMLFYVVPPSDSDTDPYISITELLYFTLNIRCYLSRHIRDFAEHTEQLAAQCMTCLHG